MSGGSHARHQIIEPRPAQGVNADPAPVLGFEDVAVTGEAPKLRERYLDDLWLRSRKRETGICVPGATARTRIHFLLSEATGKTDEDAAAMA
jgi:hypothetical protein